MKTKRCVRLGLAMALAGGLLLAGTGLAQNQGGGGPAGQGKQLCTGGPGGTCVVNPAQGSGNQNSPGPGAGKSQKRQGMKGNRGGAQSGQPTTQANPPASTNQ